jgi:hypothetical protein
MRRPHHTGEPAFGEKLLERHELLLGRPVRVRIAPRPLHPAGDDDPSAGLEHTLQLDDSLADAGPVVRGMHGERAGEEVVVEWKVGGGREPDLCALHTDRGTAAPGRLGDHHGRRIDSDREPGSCGRASERDARPTADLEDVVARPELEQVDHQIVRPTVLDCHDEAGDLPQPALGKCELRKEACDETHQLLLSRLITY